MFCNKCGNELDFDAAFCNLCGAPVERNDETSDLSVEESIALADKLKTRYSQVEKLEREVEDNNKRINGPLNLEYRRYSFFRFYWKFFVFAVIAFYLMLIIALIADGAGFLVAMVYIVPIGILIAGIFLAIKRRNLENDAIERGNDTVVEQRRTLEKKNEELKKTLNTRKMELKQFNDIVPAQFRKSASMAQVKSLLITKKASSFNEAFRMLK
ncbi:MAG: hypothetical protein IKZ42_02030 [Clostridiales bacterium]|nr:hypothetical protein [Clostridiales bacterium]